jgi:hypothetical protein
VCGRAAGGRPGALAGESRLRLRTGSCPAFFNEFLLLGVEKAEHKNAQGEADGRERKLWMPMRRLQRRPWPSTDSRSKTLVGGVRSPHPVTRALRPSRSKSSRSFGTESRCERWIVDTSDFFRRTTGNFKTPVRLDQAVISSIHDLPMVQ